MAASRPPPPGPPGNGGAVKAAAIIPAAGAGTRFGVRGNKASKQFHDLGGLPLLVHVLRAFERSSVQAVYIAAPRGRAAWVRREMVQRHRIRKVRAVWAGGASRGESVRRCVDRIPAGYNVLVVHDGARPLVTPALIDSVTAAAFEHGAALAAVPETDTVKSVRKSGAGEPGGEGGERGSEWVRRTERRETLWRAQTPQAFRAEVFRDALRRAAETGFDGTDDASFVEEAGGRVRIVPGDVRNVKVTDPTDLLLAEALWLDATGGRRAGKARPGGEAP